MRLSAQALAREIAAANEAYRAGDYAAAAARYEAVIAEGADGADLFYNLGNALYRAGEIGRAALAYERALRRDPDHGDARTNLELVRSQATEAAVQAPAPTLLDRLGARTDPDAAAAILLAGWSLACAAWIVRRALRAGGARLVATLALALLLLVTAAAGTATFAGWRLRSAGFSVVVEAGDLLRAPEPGAAAIAPLHEGLRVQAGRRIGRYAHVRIGDREGWFEAARIEPIDLPARRGR